MTNAFGKLKANGIVPKIGMKLSVTTKLLPKQANDMNEYDKFRYILNVVTDDAF